MQTGRFSMKRAQIGYPYAVAVFATAATVLVRLLLQPILHAHVPLLLLTIAVMAAAYTGGLGPGLLATGLCMVAGSLLFIQPVHQVWVTSPTDQVRLAIFLCVGVVMSLLSESMHRARRRAQENAVALSDSEQRFRGTFENAAVGISHIDPQGQWLRVNQKLCDLLGYDRAELLKKTFGEVTHPDDLARDWEQYRQLLQGRVNSYSIEKRYIRKDGSTIWANVTRAVQRDASGHPTYSIAIIQDISDRKQTEEALRQSEDRFREAFAHAPVGMVLTELNGRFLHVNAAYCRIVGYSEQELLDPSFNFQRLTCTDDLPSNMDAMRRMLAGEIPAFFVEKRYLHKNGSTVWVRASATARRDEQGRPVQIVGLVEDITARKQAEGALRESEARLRAFYNSASMPMGVVELADDDGDIVHLYDNPATCRFFGREPDSSAECRASELGATPEVIRLWIAHYHQSRVTGQPVRFEYEQPRPQGMRWLSVVVAYIGPGVSGRSRFSYIVEDITDRKQAEVALRESEERFRAFMDHSPTIAWAKDERGRHVYLNKTYERRFGVRLEEWRGKTDLEVWPADIAQRFRANDLTILSNSQPSEVMEETTDRDGRRCDWWNFKFPFRDAAGNRYVGGVGIDITERKRAEQTLQRKTQSLNLLYDSATQLLLTEEPEQLIQMLFGKLAEHLGLQVYFNYLVTEDGQRLHLNSCGDTDPKLRQQLQHLEFGQAVCGCVAQERQRIVVEDIQNSCDLRADLVRSLGITAYACHPLMAQGRLFGTLSFGTRTRSHFEPEELELMRAVCDQVAMALERRRLLIELRHRAEQLVQANAAKDHFLAVLSHELRTPLTPVVAAAGMLEKDQRLPDDVREDMQMIRRNVEMEKRLIDDLLDLTRIARGKLEMEMRPVDVASVLRQAVEICSPGADAKGLRLVAYMDDCQHHVRADAGRLQQVFWNLLNNAIKFTPPGGSITVRCGNRDGRLTTEVTDTGIGIEPDALGRIFDAFEQQDRAVTREFGGLGLGLSISKAIVEQHGGSIRARSEGRGKGTTFTVELPRLHEGASAAKPATVVAGPKPNTQERSLRILLVEDHLDTAKLMSRLLRANGHEVRTAGSVASALEWAAREDFDLILSDLGLPDGSGHDLMRQIRSRRPLLKGIALSGYGQDSDIQKSREAGYLEHVTKPVDIGHLEAAIARVVSDQA